jgi:hypothetical protein
MTLSRASIVLLLIATVLALGVAYDRGKKCGAWEAEFAGTKGEQAQLQQPVGCWKLR